MKSQDEFGFTWSHSKARMEHEAKVYSGSVATKARVNYEMGRICASIHGTVLTNPDAVEGSGDYGFLEKFHWPSIDAAKAAIRAVCTPRQ